MISPRRGACANGFGPQHEQARLASGFALEPHAVLPRLAPVAPCANAPKLGSRGRRDPAGADAASAWSLSAWCVRRGAPALTGEAPAARCHPPHADQEHHGTARNVSQAAHAPPGTMTWRTVVSARGVKSQAKPQLSRLYQSVLRSRRGALAYHLCEVSMPRLPPHAALPRQRRQPPAIMAAPQRRNAMSHQIHCSRGTVSLTWWILSSR